MSINLFFIRVLQFPVRLYAWFFSPLSGPQCRFYPTCSSYMLQAIEKHGVLKGLFLGTKRIFCCHPWSSAPACDSVPERFAWSSIFRYKRTH